jgi:hypothetical protein
MRILFMVALLVLPAIQTTPAQAGGPWSNQYCNIKTTHIRVVDIKGNIVEEKTEEKVECEDGVKDFLHGMGIAESCQYFTWMMPMGQKMVEQKSIACKKLDGGYEIVEGYHYIK